MPKKVNRLHRQFSPKNYNLSLDINSDDLTFSGSVAIQGNRTGRPSKRITFHQKDLKINSAEIIHHSKDGDSNIKISRINTHKSLDEVRLHSDSLIGHGEYTVVINFSGIITKPMNGIYPCFFKHLGKDKKLIATQFESHHAREAFPCIDEPEAKATYDLTLISAAGETVLSNTPVKNQDSSQGKLTTVFETTPKMSSYLLAFVIGDIKSQQAKTKNGVVVSSYATPDYEKSLGFSVDVAVKVLEFFEDYFGVKYPLQKLDMVALPDFSSGAMENWGLVTYRESVMLVDENSTGIETKQHVALVVAHELSHQWFGNLVTMRWWDDLWLNESFANMMEYRAVDEIFPEWKIFETFVGHEGISARRRDSLRDVQPVHCQVNHPDEISTLFDPSIVYAKGGTLLYMLMNYIGEAAFRKGLKDYFLKHQYGNTEANDLWSSLSSASGENIGDLMHNWLSHPGFPIVEVDWLPGDNKVGLNQTRFDSQAEMVNESTIWQVPLASNNDLQNNLLNKQRMSTTIKDTPSKALILNSEGKSYFLPKYTNDEHLQDIIGGIKGNKVSSIDKLLLLDNYNLMQRAGYVKTIDLLNLVSAYENETNENVWASLTMALAEARRLIEPDSKEDNKLDILSDKLVAKLVAKLGWDDNDDDSAQTLQLRGLVYSIAISAKNPKLIDEALSKFQQLKSPADLSPSTRSVIYTCAAKYGNDDDFDKLLGMYGSDISADDKEEVAGALCSAKDTKRIHTLIDILKTDTIRRQNLISWWASLLRNRYSRDASWAWLEKNWDWAEKEFSSDKSFSYFARIAGSIFSKQGELDKFEKFFSDKQTIVALTRDITLAQQEIAGRVQWRKRNQQEVQNWLMKI